MEADTGQQDSSWEATGPPASHATRHASPHALHQSHNTLTPMEIRHLFGHALASLITLTVSVSQWETTEGVQGGGRLSSVLTRGTVRLDRAVQISPHSAPPSLTHEQIPVAHLSC